MKTKLIIESQVPIYKDPTKYSHNPVVQMLPEGKMLCVFREAPRRRRRTHIDMSSKAVMLTSHDAGKTWDAATRTVIFQKEGWGIQDPSIRLLSDGTLICNFFIWVQGGQNDFPADCPFLHNCGADHYTWVAGSYTIRSTDLGKTWEPAVKVASPTGDYTTTSDPIIELANGDLMIPLEGANPGQLRTRTMVALSSDKGRSWKAGGTVAYDPFGNLSFHETGLLALPSGKVLAMSRSHMHPEGEYGHYLFQSESLDNGQTWSTPRKTNIWGHPANMIRLPSGAIMCAYGHRRSPYGVRACLSHDEGQTWDVANELIFRNDGIDMDVGYPTSTLLPNGRIFTAWYMTEPMTAESLTRIQDSIFGYTSPQAYLAGNFLREVPV